ncbi:Hypothetical protein NTJ_13489 [Nesidiocoris tenuis]|uniref:BESS domain-containing protein n=1 Tax=Nesidiocoris tenuis TaxID=355587 RepID=A0ABN7BCX9_9HEMI|nr:Hypothetical protein NTJ_13489 [Nesidiocoris tenuis]
MDYSVEYVDYGTVGLESIDNNQLHQLNQETREGSASSKISDSPVASEAPTESATEAPTEAATEAPTDELSPLRLKRVPEKNDTTEDDMQYFKSLLPYMKGMTTVQKLMLRAEFSAALMRIQVKKTPPIDECDSKIDAKKF